MLWLLISVKGFDGRYYWYEKGKNMSIEITGTERFLKGEEGDFNRIF